jgi:hypothetical protein
MTSSSYLRPKELSTDMVASFDPDYFKATRHCFEYHFARLVQP